MPIKNVGNLGKARNLKVIEHKGGAKEVVATAHWISNIGP